VAIVLKHALVHQLKAEVLCRSDRLDLMVESLAIGAMNVNAAVKYFRKGGIWQ
jgi:BioD-like phosphotransacetylase family protein